NERLEEHIQQRTVELHKAVEQLKTEVADRSLAEQALRESEQRYRMISELSSDWSFRFHVDAHGRMSSDWITDSLIHVTGFSRERLLETGYFALVHSEDRKDLEEEARRIFVGVHAESRRNWETEHRIVTAGGQTRWVQVQLEIDPAGDQGVRVTGAARDISERRAAEEEHRRLEDHLRDVQRLESLGVLAERIAHDFNNQLTVILGNSSLALSEVGQDTPLQERLQRIRAAARHSASLTEQMLTYAGKASAALRTIHLPHLMEGMQELIEASIARHCDLDLSSSEALPLIEGDEGQLRQVAVNLVTNASESLNRRPGTVRIRTGLIDADAAYLRDTFGPSDLPEGEYVYLEVQDNGTGIPAGDRGRIFEPFYTTRFSGRGLGLAAVLGIVSGHRGVVKLQSEEGRGTTIRVLFPTIKLLEATRAKKSTGRDSRSCILVIDDDEAVQELLKEIFQRSGYRIIPVDDESQALKILGEMPGEIGVVLLDADTPGSQPARTLERIRECDADLPVVISTGFAHEHAFAQLGELNIAGIVSMPFDEAKLIEVVEAALHPDEGPEVSRKAPRSSR
ncbi:MAG: ATP-binding protein, partial [Myxococcota bacterium]